LAIKFSDLQCEANVKLSLSTSKVLLFAIQKPSDIVFFWPISIPYFPEINGTLELGFQGQNMVMIIYDEHQLNF
jgi:hypothetical protein